MNKVLILFFIFILGIKQTSFAANYTENNFKNPNKKEQRQIDDLLITRLNLDDKQVEQLKKIRVQHKKQMDKIVKKMQEKHDEIRSIYYLGIPKFQTEIKSAPHKTQLIILKQEADKLRQENRKTFENMLTKEQKIEFEKLRKELREKAQINSNSYKRKPIEL